MFLENDSSLGVCVKMRVVSSSVPEWEWEFSFCLSEIDISLISLIENESSLSLSSMCFQLRMGEFGEE